MLTIGVPLNLIWLAQFKQNSIQKCLLLEYHLISYDLLNSNETHSVNAHYRSAA
jgi:protein-arginine kinase